MNWIVATFFSLFLYYCFYNLRTSFFFRVLLNKNPIPPPKEPPFVSVIVAARDEALNIGKLILCLRQQDYPASHWEVIIVNDHSEDETLQQADFFSKGMPNIRILSAPENKAGKKAALEYAISEAKGEIILCTDADCVFGNKWISSMVSAFTEETAVVSGPVKLHASGTAFQNMQALEFMGLVATGAAAIESGKPTLANGANFAYRKSAFIKVGGYEGNEGIPTGDDEFLLHKISAIGTYKVAFVANRDAIVSTDPQPDWQSFRSQRIRWVSKSLAYRRKGISMSLSAIWLGMWLFPLLAIAGAFHSDWLVWLAFALLLKLLSEFTVLASAAGFFDNFNLLLWLVPESLLHIFYVLWVGIAGNFSAFTWKNRKYTWKR